MTLKINFYCNEKYRNRIPEPVEASKSFPKWYSNLPLVSKTKYAIEKNDIHTLEIDSSNANIKKCVGITDFLKTGYLIPSWADFVFREQEDGNLYINWVKNYYDEMNYVSHGETQYSTMPNKPIYGHFGKVLTPWIVKTDPGVSCLITHPVWHNNKNFTTTTAVFHTDKSPLKLAWFFEWNYKIKTKMNVDNIDIQNQVISKGEPIILIIPFYRKKFSSRINYVSENSIENMIKSARHLVHDTIRGECPYTNFRKTLGKLF